MTIKELTEIREKAVKQAENATNEELVNMFEKSAQNYQAEVMGECTIDGIDATFERMYVLRQELLKRLG